MGSEICKLENDEILRLFTKPFSFLRQFYFVNKLKVVCSVLFKGRQVEKLITFYLNLCK